MAIDKVFGIDTDGYQVVTNPSNLVTQSTESSVLLENVYSGNLTGTTTQEDVNMFVDGIAMAAVFSGTNTVVVDPSNPAAVDDTDITTPFITVSAAIAQAPTGYTVRIFPGVYIESFLVSNKSLRFLGQEGVVFIGTFAVDSSTSGPTSLYCVVENIHFRWDTTDGSGQCFIADLTDTTKAVTRIVARNCVFTSRRPFPNVVINQNTTTNSQAIFSNCRIQRLSAQLTASFAPLATDLAYPTFPFPAPQYDTLPSLEGSIVIANSRVGSCVFAGLDTGTVQKAVFYNVRIDTLMNIAAGSYSLTNVTFGDHSGGDAQVIGCLADSGDNVELLLDNVTFEQRSLSLGFNSFIDKLSTILDADFVINYRNVKFPQYPFTGLAPLFFLGANATDLVGEEVLLAVAPLTLDSINDSILYVPLEPTNKKLYITKIICKYITVTSAPTIFPEISIGTNGPNYDNILGQIELAGFNSTARVFTLPLSFITERIEAPWSDIYLSVKVAGNGTTFSSIRLYGFYGD